MADDLDRAGRGSGRRCRPGWSHSGRAGTPPGSWGSFAGPGGSLNIREEVPAGLGGDFIVFRYIIYVFR